MGIFHVGSITKMKLVGSNVYSHSSGQARLTSFGATANAQTVDFQVEFLLLAHQIRTPLTLLTNERPAISVMSPHPTVGCVSWHTKVGIDWFPMLGHYVENTGNTTLHFLEIFKSST